MNVSLSLDELWMIYDKVAAETEARDRASTEAMVDTGAAPWRDLRDRLRVAITDAIKQ